jgi:hypothetical protein
MLRALLLWRPRIPYELPSYAAFIVLLEHALMLTLA